MTLNISSPCRGICKIDEPSQLCEGCYRSIDEITRWSRMTDDQKLATLSACLGRDIPSQQKTENGEKISPANYQDNKRSPQ